MKTHVSHQNLLVRTWMQQALLRLIEAKSLSDITVTEVTKLAGVSRITFYRNYTELVDILFDYLEMQQFGLAQNPAAEEYLPQLIRSYFIFFHENRSLFQCIQTYNLLPPPVRRVGSTSQLKGLSAHLHLRL